MYNPIWISINYMAAFIMLFINVIYLSLLIRFHKVVKWNPKPLPEKELPTLSVIIPAYNESENLKYSIESVLNSDYPKDKLEIIVVDDGSKDDTYDVAKRYVKQGVKVYRKKNGGAADAKNYGVKRSKGTLIATIDSDTIVDKYAFRKLVRYFREKDVAAATAAVRIYSPKNIIEKIQSIEYDIILFLRRLMMAVESIYVTPGGLSVYRRDAFIKIGGFNKNSLTEDQEIAINLQKNRYKIRSSLEAVSYTKCPDNIIDLLKQRIRWLRGGIWNRRYHKDLYSFKSGDFLLFGMVADFVNVIPLVIFGIGLIKNMIFNGLWVQRLGYIEAMLISIDPLMLTLASVSLIGIPYVIYMVNHIRKTAGGETVSSKDILPFLLFAFVYGYIWTIVWIFTIYKELKGSGYEWGTR